MPKPGTKTNICKTKPKRKIYGEFFLSHVPVIYFDFAIKNITTRPAKIEITCLEKTEIKKSLSFSLESEAEKKIKDPIKTRNKVIYSIFLSSFFNIFLF
jgi:hypothetical protein